MHELNEEIRDKEIRLIGSEGEQLGIMPPAEALKIADEQGLDLVKISPQAVPPVCKLMNFSMLEFTRFSIVLYVWFTRSCIMISL